MEATPGLSGSVREPVATPGFVETPSDDPGTDREDELEYVSLLPTMIFVADSGLRRRMSDVSGRIFRATTAGAG